MPQAKLEHNCQSKGQKEQNKDRRSISHGTVVLTLRSPWLKGLFGAYFVGLQMAILLRRKADVTPEIGWIACQRN